MYQYLHNRKRASLLDTALEDTHRNLQQSLLGWQGFVNHRVRSQGKLELRNMEHKVQLAGWRKLKPICNCTHASQDTERTEILKRQIMAHSASNRRLTVRLQFQEHEIAKLELAFSAILVGLRLHALLNPQQVLEQGVGDDMTVGEPLL